MNELKRAREIGRNDPCPCGSGIKYKRCCLPNGPAAYGNRIQHQTVPVTLGGTRTEIPSSFIFDGKRFRILWNRLHWSPQEQTFHEFLDYLVLQTLNRQWFNNQAGLPAAERHVVFSWRRALLDLLKTPATTPDGGWVMTGPITAYLCFAYDLYWLQLIHRLPRTLERRLRDREAFQGARYEVAIGAIFARAGFEIELLDETVKSIKHCEFVATHKRTRTRVHVEAKSRRRPGVLNQPGIFDAATHVKGDIFGLYTDAVRQCPPTPEPYFIFIDANVPSDVPKSAPAYGLIPIETYPWMKEIQEGLNGRWAKLIEPTPETAVCITNYASYFGNEQDAAPIGVCGLFPSPRPRAAIADARMLDDFLYCLRYYTTIPRQF
jgi:SEC-C motif